MKSLTIPLSVLLVKEFYFNPNKDGIPTYIPSKRICVPVSPNYSISHVVVCSDDQYQVEYLDGSNLRFGKDENIMIQG